MRIYSDQDIVGMLDLVLTEGSENNFIELKDGRGGVQQDLWKTITSFSHRPNGGVIAFGFKENRDDSKTIEVVDIANVALFQERLSSYFNDRMENCERPDIRTLDYKNHKVVVAVIREVSNESKPCYERSIGLPNGACVRVGNTNRKITPEEMRQMIRSHSTFKFDKSIVPDVDIEIISRERVKYFLGKSATKTQRSFPSDEVDDSILENLSIVKNEGGTLKPTVAGALIFSIKQPQSIPTLARYVIRCVRYGGVSPASPIIDKMDISGTLDQQIEEMQKFVLRNIPLHAEIVGTKRVEKYEYHPEAIRELVANAVIHRDYRTTETYTQINIFSNRIEISNAGNLPPGITIENIKDSQFSRNETIASILKDMDYLEEYGRGIDIVFSRMTEYGLLGPIFKNISNSFKATLLGKAFKTLNERQVKIWQLIQEKNKTTTKECVDFFVDISRATISNDLNKLIELGLIKSVGSSNNIHYVPEY